jgi:hypothetical protein
MLTVNVKTSVSLPHPSPEKCRALSLATAAAVLASSEPYVPYRTGKLCESGHVRSERDGAVVVWDVSYAKECYEAHRPFSREVHPLATARWVEAARATDGEVWEKTARKAFLET